MTGYPPENTNIDQGGYMVDIVKLIYTDLHENKVSNLVQASSYHKIWTGLKATLSQ